MSRPWEETKAHPVASWLTSDCAAALARVAELERQLAEAKKPRDHRKCSYSTGVDGDATAGSGELDNNGYWSEPCNICAASANLRIARNALAAERAAREVAEADAASLRGRLSSVTEDYVRERNAATAAEGEVARLEGLILDWRRAGCSSDSRKYHLATDTLATEAERIREREGR